MKYWIAALLLSIGTIAQAGALQPLRAADIPALVASPAHGERLIALWALDCAYCEPNLRALARLQQAHAGTIELVTVATDDFTQRKAIEERLHTAGVEAWKAYAYADATPERMSYLLDSGWGGETPRVLVIRADGTRQGYSGELTEKQLRAITP
ncbi:MAG: hypothetical protein HOQ10_09365 [Frateuria sp.]|uniref:TlpA family protein disulfide reductase n=1 Tax=Frateuria sp. TaxID=2211372 RepID=UPI00179D2CD0|nr:hypothetical protein [Frateuria sp.]NUO72908.1 hypothetical protein [Frateuria sp.]NUR23308.1 hypothetical protein [Frateuria sp.]